MNIAVGSSVYLQWLWYSLTFSESVFAGDMGGGGYTHAVDTL